jgi:hypothetical protein
VTLTAAVKNLERCILLTGNVDLIDDWMQVKDALGAAVQPTAAQVAELKRLLWDGQPLETMRPEQQEEWWQAKYAALGVGATVQQRNVTDGS